MNTTVPPRPLLGYLPLFWPLLCFPAVYVPYRLWGIAPFANLFRRLFEGQAGNSLWLAFYAEQTVIFFWLAVSAVVFTASAVVAALQVRPWFFIPIYLLMSAGLCGLFALLFYSLMAS